MAYCLHTSHLSVFLCHSGGLDFTPAYLVTMNDRTQTPVSYRVAACNHAKWHHSVHCEWNVCVRQKTSSFLRYILAWHLISRCHQAISDLILMAQIVCLNWSSVLQFFLSFYLFAINVFNLCRLAFFYPTGFAFYCRGNSKEPQLREHWNALSRSSLLISHFFLLSTHFENSSH